MLFSKLILLLSLLLVPLLPASGVFGYEQIKVLFFILVTTLIQFIWIFKGKFKWTYINITSLIFIVSLLLTSFVGIDLRASLIGKTPYFQGWLVYIYLYLFSILVLTIPIRMQNYAIVLNFSAIIVSFIAIRQWVEINFFNIPIPTYAGRVVSSFGQPNFYAGFLLLVLPITYLLIRDSTKKWQYLGWGSGVFSLIAILVSYSRSAILLSLILICAALIPRLVLKFRWVFIIFGITALFIALGFSIGSYGLVWDEITRPLSTNNPDLTKQSIEKRAYIWPLSVNLFLQKPLTGYGLENINSAFFEYFDNNKHALFEENLNVSPLLISLKDLNIDRTHNYILDLLLFSGIPGLLGWLILLGFLFNKLRKKYRDRNMATLGIALIVYIVWVQFQNQSIIQLIYFWLLVGLIDREI